MNYLLKSTGATDLSQLSSESLGWNLSKIKISETLKISWHFGRQIASLNILYFRTAHYERFYCQSSVCVKTTQGILFGLESGLISNTRDSSLAFCTLILNFEAISHDKSTEDTSSISLNQRINIYYLGSKTIYNEPTPKSILTNQISF